MFTASYGHYNRHAARIRPDRIGLSRTGHPAPDVPPKRARITLCTTGPNPIWMAWPRSGFGQTHQVWKQSCLHESMGQVLAECTRPATSFPLSDSGAFFHLLPRYYCANQPGSTLVLADCAGFWPNGSSPGMRVNNNNNVHLSCTHQHPDRSHDTY